MLQKHKISLLLLKYKITKSHKERIKVVRQIAVEVAKHYDSESKPYQLANKILSIKNPEKLGGTMERLGRLLNKAIRSN